MIGLIGKGFGQKEDVAFGLTGMTGDVMGASCPESCGPILAQRLYELAVS
jgi:hypothetical protein